MVQVRGIVRSWIVSGVVIATVACGAPHAYLQAPPPTAPVETRVQAYEQLRPLGSLTVVTTYHGQPTDVHPDHLQLASGQRVYHVEDLEAVVPPDSPTARAARESRAAARKVRTWGTFSLIATAVGTSLMLSAIAVADPDNTRPAMTLVLAGGGVAIAGAVMLFPMMVYRKRANDAKHTAFLTYDSSLRRHLHLCVDGMKLISCP
jgi:hypothetical protein